MSRRLIGIILILIFCTACQFGKIPCPKIKEDRVRRHFRPSDTVLSARANQEQETQRQSPKNSDPHFVKNVSVEEWDCPRPGAKKYKPKSVRDNIRRNTNKIKSDHQKQDHSDSPSF